jgi:hypothetical protein
VAQYASLAVELAMRPEQRAETLRRYRLTEMHKTALDEMWSRRFAADPAAGAAYAQACADYRSWLRSRG